MPKANPSKGFAGRPLIFPAFLRSHHVSLREHMLRLGLAACAVVFLLIWFAISKVSKAPVDEESEETDEVVKILLLTDTGNGAADGIQNPPPKITFNVAVVLVVSLLSVVLLITGIIVLAVTLDPNSQNEDEDDVESYGDDYVGNSFRSMWFEAHTIADISDEDYNDPKVSINEL
ncbi:hypothetical protein QR680_001556 [Steinernema hermaphroditum]|uniref:Uncharacterized protein n=1 Tax=Steinernema hermaphroditum TaxID=289476 RepID=A0AA39LG68_9BILA|nr:hypothetical protein QR680_001556 [Steinernema hermaphroditum]